MIANGYYCWCASVAVGTECAASRESPHVPPTEGGGRESRRHGKLSPTPKMLISHVVVVVSAVAGVALVHLCNLPRYTTHATALSLSSPSLALYGLFNHQKSSRRRRRPRVGINAFPVALCTHSTCSSLSRTLMGLADT